MVCMCVMTVFCLRVLVFLRLLLLCVCVVSMCGVCVCYDCVLFAGIGLFETAFLDGYCSTVQGLLEWFEVDLRFTELLFIQIEKIQKPVSAQINQNKQKLGEP